MIRLKWNDSICDGQGYWDYHDFLVGISYQMITDCVFKKEFSLIIFINFYNNNYRFVKRKKLVFKTAFYIYGIRD